MKGKIDKGGALWIERCGKIMIQFCPYGKYGDHCGHQCPLFSDPREDSGEDILLNALRDVYKLKPLKFIRIELCQKTLIFDEFIDERKA